MAHLFGRLGELEEEHVRKLPDAMRRMITDTLSATITFPVEGERVVPSRIYQRLLPEGQDFQSVVSPTAEEHAD